jgi:hypothetical protein
MVHEFATGQVCSDKPSRGWQQNLMRRAEVLCDLQVAFVLVKYLKTHSFADLVALHDGTTKLGVALAGAGLNIGGAYYSLGVEAVSDGTALSAFTSLLRRLDWICSTLPQGSEDQLQTKEVLLRLRSSLSDRCKVEIKWARLLEERRFEEVEKEFATLFVEEKKDKAKVFKFFCMAHGLSGMTAEVEKLF